MFVYFCLCAINCVWHSLQLCTPLICKCDAVEVDLTKQLEEAYRSIHSMDAGSVQTLPPSDANMQQLMKLQDDLVQELNDMKSDMAKLAARNKALGEEKTRLERSCLEQQASTGERQSLASHCQTLEEDNVRLQQEMRAFTEIWQREKEDYESKLLSFAEYQKNAQVFRKEHEDLEKKVNGFANLAYAWENEKKAYETKVAELSRRPTLLQVVQNCSFRLFVVVCAHD
jgi:DNA repair exonuclease SbcCD ATPase subunit